MSHPLVIATLLLAVAATGGLPSPPAHPRPVLQPAGDRGERAVIRGAWGQPFVLVAGASAPPEPAGCAMPGAPGIWCAPKRLYR